VIHAIFHVVLMFLNVVTAISGKSCVSPTKYLNTLFQPKMGSEQAMAGLVAGQ
jgi:hypothetical protein